MSELKKEHFDWYPGHMTKARRMMDESLSLVDLVIELIDARIPLSGRNPDIDALAAGKARCLIFTKEDLADPAQTAAFCDSYKMQGFACLSMDARQNRQKKPVLELVEEVCRERIERNRRRGIVGRPMRAMVVGIPNVGKSTFINSVMGKAVAKTGNLPGVTRGKQWLRLNKNLELLDTPGITWPKFEEPDIALRLALVGSMKDAIIDKQVRWEYLRDFLADAYPEALGTKYGADTIEGIAEQKHFLLPGGLFDTDRAQSLVLEDFKNGRIGRITLDRAPLA